MFACACGNHILDMATILLDYCSTLNLVFYIEKPDCQCQKLPVHKYVPILIEPLAKSKYDCLFSKLEQCFNFAHQVCYRKPARLSCM